MTALITDAMDVLLLETIEKNLRDARPKLMPLLDDVEITSKGVSDPSGLGRNYQCKRVYIGSGGGALQWRQLTGPTTITGLDGAQVVYSDTNTGFPALAEMGQPGTYLATISLAESLGGFVQPIDLLQANQLSSALFDIVPKYMKEYAKLPVYAEIFSFFKLNADGRIGTFTTPGSSEDIDTTGYAVTLTSGSIKFFYRNMQVDLFEGTTWKNVTAGVRDPVVVTNVDYQAGTVFLRLVSGTTVNLTASTSVSIMPAGTCRTGQSSADNPNGLVNWIINTGTVHGLNVDTYPEHASLIYAANQPLSGQLLDSIMAGNQETLDIDLDTLIVQPSVMTAALANVENQGRFRMETQGQAPQVKYGLGGGSWRYEYDGTPLTIRTTPYCHDQTGWLLKMKGNYQKLVPPGYGGEGRVSDFGSNFSFVGKLFGSTSIWMPMYSSTAQLGTIRWAPFVSRFQIAPNSQIPGIKLTGLQVNRIK